MLGVLQTIIYFSFLFLLFGIMQWYVGRFYVSWVKSSVEKERQLSWLRAGLIFMLFANLIFSFRFITTEFGFYDNLFTQSLIIYPGGVFFAGITLAFAALLITDGVRYSIKGIKLLMEKFKDHQQEKQDAQHFDPGRRKFLKTAGSIAVASPFIVTMSSSAATSRDYNITRPELFFPDLPTGLDGLKIVQISDLHSGIYMTERQISEIFEISNSLNPEIVSLTGDLVDTSTSEISSIYNTLPMLKSEYGVFGCLGNHDHYASGSAVSAAVRQRNIPMLNNSRNHLMINGEPLDILGVDDAGSGSRNFARLDRALEGSDPDHFKLLLSHRPNVFDFNGIEQVDLTLAGHTHGGQIGGRFMGIPIYPVSLFHDYTKGLFTRENRKMYVNVGVGMVGVPIRIVRPEITLITLRKGSPQNDVGGVGG